MKLSSLAINSDALVWLPEYGMGYHTAPAISYDEDYFDNYLSLDASEMGSRLNHARVNLVENYWNGEVVDIGVGAGRFVKEKGCFGFDVNDKAVNWLKRESLFCDPYVEPVDCITCWDSLEHIPEPEKLIAQVKCLVFVSMPIYKDADDVLQSKHYKPGEHLWYWTHEGLQRWFHSLGFAYVMHNKMETDIGREGIKTYVFKRVR
ncbi:methyltransferase domain-containing protein [Methylophaga sp. OBS4]|uniref:methyltransferase domain-containing protein n=1 Tax=Methylophaga sp. OBS4 TaxID=2991935 RepID=UPI0022530AED|nr:methyltransferase domain-containing protein [Methylophaga sp. OBS4]MCX4186768.1 class I SAM-dependent methyltransferase [Methylophaga sp. OBS4]